MPLIKQRLAVANPVAGAVLKLNYLRLDRDEQSRPAEYQRVWKPGLTIQPGEGGRSGPPRPESGTTS